MQASVDDISTALQELTNQDPQIRARAVRKLRDDKLVLKTPARRSRARSQLHDADLRNVAIEALGHLTTGDWLSMG